MVQALSTPAAATDRAPHLRHIEGLRALAAYVVYVNHVYAQTWSAGAKQFPPRALSLLTYSLVAGHFAVSVFIVISGFCLSLPLIRDGGELRGGVKAFLKRRARRILPPYYAAVALCLLLIWTIIGKPTGTLWDVPILATNVSIIAHLLLLQNLFATSHINYVFWSIAVEWQIYFLFPVIVWVWRRYGVRVAVGSALVVGYALRFGFEGTRIERATPYYVGLFAMGMLAAAVARSPATAYVRLRRSVPWGSVAVAGVAVTAALCRLWGWYLAIGHFDVLDFVVAVAVVALLVHTSGPSERAATRVLAWRPLAFVGTFSYSLYLIHAPLIQVVWQYVLHPLRLEPVPMFLAFMGPVALLILAASYGFFRMFEEPFMRQRKRRDPSKAEQPAAGAVARG
jgi:peptidoglycan/LPS O-acetylase OafA/YrhL